MNARQLAQAIPQALPLGPLPAAPATRRIPRPDVLMCDLDGTLVDTMPILADLATQAINETYGMPRGLAREMYLTTSGLPFHQQLERIFPGDRRNADTAARYEAAKPERCRGARMTPDTRRALALLQTRGVQVVVSSNNGVDNVSAFARDSEFPFDLALGHDGNGFGKGRPHVEEVARSLGVRRSGMLFCGDSLYDGEVAQREGLRFVGVTGTFSRERFALRFPGTPVVDRLAQLVSLLA
jgi:phosphoglycolate phosphatase-like HAD superfamily hydrolase